MPRSRGRIGVFTYSKVSSVSTYSPLVNNGYGSAATSAWVAFASLGSDGIPSSPLPGIESGFFGPAHPHIDTLLNIRGLGWRLGDSLNSPARGYSAAQIDAFTQLGQQHVALLNHQLLDGQANTALMLWDIDDVIHTPQRWTLGDRVQRTGFFQTLVVSGGRYVNGATGGEDIPTDLGFSWARSSASLTGDAVTVSLWADFNEQPATTGLTSVLATADDPADVVGAQQEITCTIANTFDGATVFTEFVDDLGRIWTVAGQRLTNDRREIEIEGFRQLAG